MRILEPRDEAERQRTRRIIGVRGIWMLEFLELCREVNDDLGTLPQAVRGLTDGEQSPDERRMWEMGYAILTAREAA